MDNLEKYIADNRNAFDTETPSLGVWNNIANRLSAENHLEDFIQQNREKFDTEIPNLKLWATIDKQVNVKSDRRIVQLTWLRRIAASVALLILGGGIGYYLNGKSTDNIVVNVSPDFQETEQYYTQKVQEKITKLVSYNPDPSVMNDLKQVDEIQAELKSELEHAPSSTREEIIQKMIDNYRIKLGILERVLNHIEQYQSENQNLKQKNESI
jgi:hypothetical protein